MIDKERFGELQLQQHNTRREAVMRFLKYRGGDHTNEVVAREIAAARPELDITPVHVFVIRRQNRQRILREQK